MNGCFTAMITPFKDGRIDFDSLGGMIEHQINSGIDGIVPCGTTGESPTLSHSEHEEVVRFTIEKVAKRVKVIAGTGSNSTEECLKMSVDAEKMGADAIMVVVPYYNKPGQKALIEHYSKIASNVSLEIIIYNIPGRSVVNLIPETFLTLYEKHPNITTIKDATGNLDYASKLLSMVKGASLLSGNDTLNLPIASVGGSGCISVLSNIFPKLTKKVFSLYVENKIEEAKDLHLKLFGFTESLFLESNPSPIKYACYKKGLITSPEVRLPLIECGDELKRSNRQIFGNII